MEEANTRTGVIQDKQSGITWRTAVCAPTGLQQFFSGLHLFQSPTFHSALNMESSGTDAVETSTVRSRVKSIVRQGSEVSYIVFYILHA